MKIYDSVHGFIHFNDVESELIDSFPFQRLHYIRQLGVTYLVYPGGTHTRFEHSLGVMQVASLIFDKVTASTPLPSDSSYWRQMIRLAALCHDLGHLPFSHLAEKALLGSGGHEEWTLKIIKSPYLLPIWKKISHPTRDVIDDLSKLSVGRVEKASPWEKVLSEIITGDFFGADRIDYLLRDSQSTGVAYGLIDYHQLIEMLKILPYREELELGVEENGIESCEALLLARHFMYRRVYHYATAKAYSFHLVRFMKELYTKEMTRDVDRYLSMTDNEVLSAMNAAAKQGDPDAKALLTRHSCFKAIEIKPPLSEKDLFAFKNKLSISENEIAWELPSHKKSKVGLSFPVLKKNGSICNAKELSEILIPSPDGGWLYLDARYEQEFYRFTNLSQ
jgi:uncharacterized protein